MVLLRLCDNTNAQNFCFIFSFIISLLFQFIISTFLINKNNMDFLEYPKAVKEDSGDMVRQVF